MTTTPSPEAVEVLQRIADGCDDAQDVATDFLRKHSMLPEQGFTITRAAPMTDAELEREVLWVAKPYGRLDQEQYYLTTFEAMALAKKYRG